MSKYLANLNVVSYCHVVAKIFVFSYTTGKLEAMLLEAKGSWAEAEKAYSSLLEDSPLDQVSSEQILP